MIITRFGVDLQHRLYSGHGVNRRLDHSDYRPLNGDSNIKVFVCATSHIIKPTEVSTPSMTATLLKANKTYISHLM
jgi:hypothetical protein